MASVKGVNATKAADPQAANILDPGLLGGKVRVMIDKYEAAALALGSDITVGKALPSGASVIGVQISTDALGAGVTVEVGDSDTSDRYIAAVDCTGATTTVSTLGADALGYVIGTNSGDDTILITTGVGAATGTISIVVLYVVE